MNNTFNSKIMSIQNGIPKEIAEKFLCENKLTYDEWIEKGKPKGDK